MTIILRALRNFGYDGQDVEQGSVIEIDPEKFGDTLDDHFKANLAVQITEWTVDGTYSIGQDVSHNGSIWQSTLDGNVGHEPTLESQFWSFVQKLANPLAVTPSVAPKPIAILKPGDSA